MYLVLQSCNKQNEQLIKHGIIKYMQGHTDLFKSIPS